MDTPQTLIGLEELNIDLPMFADGLPGGFFVYEAQGDERILFANHHLATLFACESVAEFLDYVGGTFPGMVYHRDLLRVENTIWAQAGSSLNEESRCLDHITYRIVAKDGTTHYLDDYGRLVRNTTHGDLFFVFVADITGDTGGLSLAQESAGGSVTGDQDPLTGLPSMRYYHAHSNEVLAKASVDGIPMVDVLFDIDHFRTVNFRLGYEGGDEVLQHVAHILQQCFVGDLVARFSDDHFVLLTQREGLEERIERVHGRVANLVSGMHIEIKAGICELKPNEVSIPFAHDRAKVACTSIKGRYDHFYRFFDESLATSEDLHDYFTNHLEQAIEQGWIHNYYQPVVDVRTRTCCGVEALSRWVDPQIGLFSPGRYVRVLEEARLIHMLDQAVIDTACADIQQTLQELGTAVPVSLNFSPSALTLVDVPDLVEQTVRHHNIPRDLVHVEITESSLADDPKLLRSIIARLHDFGYEVWMDDFGSGYSSLNLLKDYEFDVLKIDMEFLRGMEANERSRTIVRAITDLAHELGMTTLVEGVETQVQLDFLASVGADRAQGFLFSEPVLAAQIRDDFFRRYPPAR